MNHKRTKCLTIAELKNFKGFENYSDVEAEKTIQTLEKLSVLFFRLYTKNKEIERSHKLNHHEDLNNIRVNQKKSKNGKKKTKP